MRYLNMNIKYEYLSWGIFREGIVGDSVKMTGVATTCHLVAAGSSRLVGYERGCCCSCKRGGGGCCSVTSFAPHLLCLVQYTQASTP
jgi:hypothetical protein